MFTAFRKLAILFVAFGLASRTALAAPATSSGVEIEWRQLVDEGVDTRSGTDKLRYAVDLGIESAPYMRRQEPITNDTGMTGTGAPSQTPSDASKGRTDWDRFERYAEGDPNIPITSPRRVVILDASEGYGGISTPGRRSVDEISLAFLL
ncbi:unnamed protein product [Peniophora sp. CBMAI 1063]|nr:unnamed protein product [Peniophora sp. CBMAI 1063]